MRPRRVSPANQENPLTKPYNHVEAISGELDTLYILYRDLRWCRSDRRPRSAKMRPVESIEADRAHQEQQGFSRDLPYQAITRAQRATDTSSRQDPFSIRQFNSYRGTLGTVSLTFILFSIEKPL